jgi:diketogulonate reductase-like aldo/keto reductase
MDFKELGYTRVQVPEVGLGTWRYAGGTEPLIKGIELGAAFIDAAESYGSEEVVGEAIREFRNKVFVATKASPRNFRRADLLRAADRSLRRLSTTYIDVYQLHWPNYTIDIEETMAAMEELVDAGKIRFIGVSNFSVHVLKKAQAALSKHKIVSNQVRYSLIERTVERDLLSYCQRNGITLIAYSPFGSKFSSLQAADPAGALCKVAETTGKTPAQVALNWLLAKAEVVAIPKASTVQHVIEDCGASGWRLSPSEYELLDNQIKFRAALAPGSCREALRHTRVPDSGMPLVTGISLPC